MSNYVSPHDVHSPKDRWNLIAVLDEATMDDCALAIGRWELEARIALRWNGGSDSAIGNPQSRGIPTWFILPEKYRKVVLEGAGLSEDKYNLARGIFHDLCPYNELPAGK